MTDGRTETDRTAIVVITAGGPYPFIIANALAERFGPLTILQEEPEPKGVFLRRRARRLGWVAALGQLATMTVSRFGKRFARRREAEILAEAGIASTEPHALATVRRVGSANGADCLAAIAELRPRVVVLAGCRMLTRATLEAIDCPVINYHAGVNPAYRGMMGGYWALATGDHDNFGTTMHLVDAGVDTGGVLYVARMTPGPRDTMLTYAMLQAAGSRDIAVRAVEDALAGRLRPVTPELPSRQWFHPPLWRYLWTGAIRGVW